MLSTKMMPAVGALVPVYVLAQTANLLDTRFALIVVFMLSNLPLMVWMLYSHFKDIPPEILEAARMDGAGNIRTLVSIVWPSLRGTTIALAIVTAISSLKNFDVPYLVTNGGPNYATEFLATMIYRQSIPLGNVGYAAAISIVLLVLAVSSGIILQRSGRERTRKA
jgi:ABC-type sugar transport system permease subunit